MFKKQQRLSRKDFEYYFKTGKRFHSPTLQIIYHQHQHLHVSVVVPKKVIKTSVGRNRMRRQIYHFLRTRLLNQKGVFIVIIKPELVKITATERKQALADTVGRIIKAR